MHGMANWLIVIKIYLIFMSDLLIVQKLRTGLGLTFNCQEIRRVNQEEQIEYRIRSVYVNLIVLYHITCDSVVIYL